jgi:hypothetical protein
LIKMNIPSGSNIMKLNQSCNTTTMTMERWERPNNTTKDTMEPMVRSQNRNCTGGTKQNPLPYKTNTALASQEVRTDVPNEDDEADLDTNTPETDERVSTTTVKEVDRQSNGTSDITGKFKNLTNQPRFIDAEEEEDDPEEETNKINNQADIIDLEDDNSEDETDEYTHTSKEWFEHDEALPRTPKTTTEDAVPRPPHERLYKSRHLVKVCGHHTHGIWCDCPFIPKPSPRYHVESNLNVPQTLPTKPKTSVKMKKKEWEKNHGTPAAEEYKHGFPVDGIYSARQIRDMMRKAGRTDTIEVVATVINDDNKELVTTDINAFHNKELVAATLTVCCEEIDAVTTNIAAPDMEKQGADDTVTTAGIQHTKPRAGAVVDREDLHGQHRDEEHHHAACIKEDEEPRIRTALRINHKTMHKTYKKSVLNMTETPRNTACAHYNYEFADTNLAYNDKGFTAALTANGIKSTIATCATGTLDDELVATHKEKSSATDTLDEEPVATHKEKLSATDTLDEELVATHKEKFRAADTLDEELVATYKEKFNANTALNNYDKEFAIIFALATYDEGFDDKTLAHYEVKFDAIFDNFDEEPTKANAITTDTFDEELVDATNSTLATDEEFNDTTVHYDGESIATDALDEEFANIALAYKDEQLDEIPTPIFAFNEGEYAADHADHDEGLPPSTPALRRRLPPPSPPTTRRTPP